MTISLIVAHSKNYVIGLDNELPWYIPEDLQFFKEKTIGKPVIMGRKTFESIGKPLPGRRNIVITRDEYYYHDGIIVTNSLDEAIELACDAPEIMIIGGSQIYKEAIERNLCTKAYVTYVVDSFEGDVKFPRYNWNRVVSTGTKTSKSGVKYQHRTFDLSKTTNRVKELTTCS